MDDVFLIKLILSFFVGGTWTVLVSVVADKFGSKIGGLVAGLPSTLLYSLFFIGWTQGSAAAVQTTNVIPAAKIMINLFLLLYALLSSFGLIVAISGSFLLWGLLAALVVGVKINNFYLSFLVYLLSVLAIYWWLDKGLKIRSVFSRKVRYTAKLLVIRGLMSGTIVALAVFLAKIGGPILGGVFSLFPAMVSSTLIITCLSQGLVFSQAMTKSLLIGGICTIIYALGVRLTFPFFGFVIGTIMAAMLSLLASYLIYQVVLKRLS